MTILNAKRMGLVHVIVISCGDASDFELEMRWIVFTTQHGYHTMRKVHVVGFLYVQDIIIWDE